jgi:hypothetical protein
MNNKWKFWFDLGWYKGNEFKLLEISIFYKDYSNTFITIFSIQICKFIIGFGLDR